MAKKRDNIIKEQYKKCFKFLNECSWYIVISLLIFSLTFIIGFIFPIFFEEEIKFFVENLIENLEGKSIPYLITYIFANNLKAAFFSIIFGITFGIFPLIITISNGYLLGFVSRNVTGQEGILVMWRLLPHGIFELPAIILSIGIGLRIGKDIYDTIKKGKFSLSQYFIFVFSSITIFIFSFLISIGTKLFLENLVSLNFEGLFFLLLSTLFILSLTIISLIFGYYISLLTIKESERRSQIKISEEYFIRAARFFLLVVLPLLIIAAIIEGVLIGLGV